MPEVEPVAATDHRRRPSSSLPLFRTQDHLRPRSNSGEARRAPTKPSRAHFPASRRPSVSTRSSPLSCCLPDLCGCGYGCRCLGRIRSWAPPPTSSLPPLLPFPVSNAALFSVPCLLSFNQNNEEEGCGASSTSAAS